MSAYKDAQAQNDITRNVKQYSDLDLFFGKKVVGSDINKVTDIQAVKRSVRNLVLLNQFEKPFHPEIASGVRDILFEPMTPMTAVVLTRKIEDVILCTKRTHRVSRGRCIIRENKIDGNK